MATTPSAPEPPARPDLLIVGGTGLLGRALGRAAVGTVHATHWSSPPADETAIWHRVDLRDGGAAVAALITTLRPAAVVNAAYVQSGPDLDAVTGTAPGAMAAACAAVGARFVHVSTDVVFDGTTDRPYREDDPARPVHDYGRAKEAAERSVLAAAGDAVVVRTSLLYGDVEDPGPQAEMTTNPEITFFTDEYRSPVSVAALAAACLELAGRPAIGGVLHVAGADVVDRHEFAVRVAPLVGVDPATIRGGPGPTDDPAGPTRPRNCPLDSTRARALLTTPLPGIRTDPSLGS